MKYALMLVTSLVVGGAMVATVFLCLRRLRKIEEELWGPRPPKPKKLKKAKQ
jgi:hypothetical protein